MMAYHHSNVEGVLIADVSARIRLGKSIPERSLLRDLFEENACTDATRKVMEQFMRAAQRVVFDGQHTLTFTFVSTKAANDWANREFELRGCIIELQRKNTIPGTRVPRKWPGTPCVSWEQKAWIRI